MKEVAAALYASKICSYAQGMNIIRAKSMVQNWGIEMGALARIWKARHRMKTLGPPPRCCRVAPMTLTGAADQATCCLSIIM